MYLSHSSTDTNCGAFFSANHSLSFALYLDIFFSVPNSSIKASLLNDINTKFPRIPLLPREKDLGSAEPKV